MKTQSKIILAATAAVAVPALALAAPSFSGFGFGGNGPTPTARMGMGYEMRGGMGPGMGMMRGSGATVPAKLREALAASGVTLPSDTELSAANETMRKAMEARKAYQETDADKEALMAIRQEAAKKERDYLRSKGVTLPSEDEIAKARTTHETMAAAMQKYAPKLQRHMQQGMKNKMGQMMQGRHGGRGGRGPGQGRDQESIPAE